jgi:2-keto-4-pentenoate hydratase/2-oxohepta-3-ene-1,7-dioic acid hydratase in catechol pathway
VRWVRFVDEHGAPRAGRVVGDEIHALPAGMPLPLDDLRGAHPVADVVAFEQARLLPPVERPPSLRDFYAFEQHVQTARRARGLEMEPLWYELPVFYFSNPAAVRGPYDDIEIPPGTVELDYELEVAAVVGRRGSNLRAADAESHLAGFLVMNDWSARDVQRREMTLSLGPAKGKDFATTLGPYLVTPDELADRRTDRAYDLTMVARVNGREYSRGSLADIHWSFGELLAYASRGTELIPGDVIGSGTCGTGCILELSLVHGHDAYPWLQAGDVVELEVDGLGVQRNRIIAP